MSGQYMEEVKVLFRIFALDEGMTAM
jgi:hypothetical protein